MIMPESTDQVFIRDLIVTMSVGIYDSEKQAPQRVSMNITLNVKSNKAKNLKSIDDVVSYEKLTNDITSLCRSKHFELLEQLAEEIASICLSDKRVQTAAITLEKPDIIMETKSVGISITRSNK